MKEHKNLIGNKYGRLKILAVAEKDHLFKFRWQCQCDCGKIIIVREDAILRDNQNIVKSCGCEQVKYFWKGYGEISGHFWGSIYKGAQKRNILFQITIEQAWSQFLLQNRKCALTKLDLIFARDHRNDNHLQTASLDRIDNNLGYRFDNIQWVHKDVNRLKQDLSVAELSYWANLITNKCDISDVQEHHETKHTGKWTGYGEISGSYFCSLKHGAKSRQIKFLLTIEEIWNLFLFQNRKCGLTGLPLKFVSRYHSDKLLQTASLDRIDSKKNYTINNVHWVHKRINYLKNVFNIEEFSYWCSLINHNFTNQNLA